MLRLNSSSSEAAIEFSEVDEEYFQVSLSGPDRSATRRVSAYTDLAGIPRVFAEAARDWRGWTGGKVWESIEGDFRLELTTDRLGHVALRVQINADQGGPDPWRHEAQITLDAGQLEAIARACERLWRSGV